MLNNISWNVYFECVIVVLIIYYSIILHIYYGADIKNWKFVKFNAVASDKKKIEISKNREVGDTLINPVLDEAKALIMKAADNKASKEEILFAIQRLFSSEHFQSIETISNKDRINDFILSECANYCFIHLHAEEVRSLWKRKVDGAI